MITVTLLTLFATQQDQPTGPVPSGSKPTLAPQPSKTSGSGPSAPQPTGPNQPEQQPSKPDAPTTAAQPAISGFKFTNPVTFPATADQPEVVFSPEQMATLSTELSNGTPPQEAFDKVAAMKTSESTEPSKASSVEQVQKDIAAVKDHDSLNKALESIHNFASTPEGQKLLVEGITQEQFTQALHNLSNAYEQGGDQLSRAARTLASLPDSSQKDNALSKLIEALGAKLTPTK